MLQRITDTTPVRVILTAEGAKFLNDTTPEGCAKTHRPGGIYVLPLGQMYNRFATSGLGKHQLFEGGTFQFEG